MSTSFLIFALKYHEHEANKFIVTLYNTAII